MADLVRFDLRGIILMPRLLLAVAVLGIAACGQGVTEGVPGPEVAKSSSEPASRSPVPVFIASEPPLEGASRSGEPWPLPPAGEGVIDIVLLGDTNISYRSDPRDAFSEIRDTLLAADIVFANLEGPFAGGTDDPAASDIPGKDWRHSNPDQVEALVAAGFDAVGTANNVTLPRDALMRSLDVLDAAGIEQTGGGATLAAARAPVVLEREGVRVGIMQRSALFEPDGHAATDTLPGIATVAVETTYREDPRRNKPGRPAIIETKLTAASADELRADLQALSAVSDIQIVSFHWGMSDAVKIVGYEREIARLCIDAGADVVFGHGSHRLKPVEVYRGKPIFYDAAQGLFDDRREFSELKGGTRSQRYPEGLFVRVRATKDKVVGAEFVPMWRDTLGDDELRLYATDSDAGSKVLSDLRTRMQVSYDREPFEIEKHWVRVDLEK